MLWDDQTQRSYWYDAASGESIWADSEWVQHSDEASGHLYWRHVATGETRWASTPAEEDVPYAPDRSADDAGTVAMTANPLARHGSTSV